MIGIEKGEQMAQGMKTRLLLMLIIVVGLLLISIAPLMRIRNEGMGGPPGPISVSAKWQSISYVLIPVGAGVAILAGIGLMAIDRQMPN